MIAIDDSGIGNVVEIDSRTRARLSGNIRILGDRNRVAIGPFSHMPKSPRRNVIHITMAGSSNALMAPRLGSVSSLSLYFSHDCVLEVGDATTFNAGCEILLHEPSRVLIGPDCMIAGNVRIHTSDMHSILEAATGRRLNDAQDVTIGEHVWLANQAVVTKGVTMGAHSVAAQRSLVTKDVPPNCLVGGVPARVLKRGVTWSRHLIGGDDFPND